MIYFTPLLNTSTSIPFFFQRKKVLLLPLNLHPTHATYRFYYGIDTPGAQIRYVKNKKHAGTKVDYVLLPKVQLAVMDYIQIIIPVLYIYVVLLLSHILVVRLIVNIVWSINLQCVCT